MRVYVGITSINVKKRWNGGRGYQNSPIFMNAIQKYGWDNFRHLVLEENLTEKEAKEHEIMLIRLLRELGIQLYNISDGGEGGNGCKRTDAQKKHLSEINRGKVLGEEHKAKISASHRGKKYTEDQRKHVSEGHIGIKMPPFTDEHKQRISASLTGKKFSEERKARMSAASTCKKVVEQYTISGDKLCEYPSLKAAKQSTGINHISDCCLGKYPSAGGYRWKYKEVV